MTRMDWYAQEIAFHRTALLRTALQRLRNPDWAADAVSETLLAALERRPCTDDPQRLRAWLFGTLAHKLVDQVRRYGGDNLVVASGSADDMEQIPLQEAPAWGDPVERACSVQFVQRLANALSQLPLAHAKAFLMFEAWGHSTDDICTELGVSINHLRVMLFRARVKLRLQLQAHWA